MNQPAQDTPPAVLSALPRAQTLLLNPTRVIPAADRRIGLADLSPDQKAVYLDVLRWFETRAWEKSDRERVYTMGGYAGVGKSFLTSILIEELLNRGKQVAVLTPTGRAANVLGRKLGNLASRCAFLGTLHSFAYLPVLNANEELVGWSRRYFEKVGDTFVAKGGKIPRLDLLVVDESSMLNREMEADIEAFGLPVLAIGDHGQLSPVHGKSSWMRNPRARLEKIHRQAESSPILALATYVRQHGCLPKDAAEALQDIGIGHYRGLNAAVPALIDTYAAQGFQNTAILTWTNELRCRLNAGIHKHYHGNSGPTKGTQIICLRNDRETGLCNGMRGEIATIPTQQDVWFMADVKFPDENIIYRGPFLRAQFGLPGVVPGVEEASKLLGLTVSSMKKLGVFLDYGYSLTAHKAQGSQFSDVFVVLENGRQPNEYGRWLYTSVSRASDRLSIVVT